MSRAPSLRLRFVFNRETKNESIALVGRRYASILVEDVAFTYATKMYAQVKSRIIRTVEQDVAAEIAQMAKLYGRHITGAAEKGRGPSHGAELTGAGQWGAEPMNLASHLPQWAPRGAQYLRRKTRQGYSRQWFLRTGLLRTDMRNPNVWTGAFGPTKVTIIGKSDDYGHNAGLGASYSNRLNTGLKDQIVKRITVAKVRVTSLPRVTASANTEDIAHAIFSYDQSLGWKIFGRRAKYRPTLEPFIAFALTRSIPAAVQGRINKGLADWKGR